MEQSQILHQLKKQLLLYCYLVILLYCWWRAKPVLAGVYPPCVFDHDCLGDENCVNCPEDCGYCPIPPGSSASPLASGSPLPSGSLPPGSFYEYCDSWACSIPPGNYELYCWPGCDENAQICYRDPEAGCYQSCDDCRYCGCGEAPGVGEVPSCADLDLCGENHCDPNTGECYSECWPCESEPSPTPTPTPSPASRPNIVSLYHVVGEGTPGQISLGTPVNYQVTYEDASVAFKPTDSLVSNGSFESGSSGWLGCSGEADCSIEAGGSIYGTHSLRLRWKSGDLGKANYVSDWINAGFELRNQNVTFSFEASTPAGNNVIGNMALQTYPTGGDWNQSRYLSLGNISTAANWRRQIFPLTFPGSVPAGENRFRVVLCPPNQLNVDAYFDGVMVEQGHTAGLYTDIYAAQFNLEKDNEHDNLVQNGSFESGWTGWTRSAGGTKELVADAVYGATAVHVAGAGARVIQWAPISNNTTYTVSLTAKGNGGRISSDEWCLGGSGDIGIQGHTYVKGVNYERQSWTFTSGTCAPGQDHRLAIYFDTYTSTNNIWVDGVLLETGNTEGYFMSLTEWPFRLLFRPDEGFRLRELQTDTWSSPAPAVYDEENLVWYLDDDISVSDATLLGKDGEGNPRTFVRVDDDELIINWQFQLEDNFPLKAEEQDFWYTNLFVRDEANQDDNVLNIGLEMFNLNGWNYHRIEPVNIVQVGTVNGYVWYDVDADGVKDGNENYLPNITVAVTGYGSDSTNSGGNYSIPNVIAGSRTVVVTTPTANWECTTGCSQSVVVPPGGTVTANFGIRPLRGTISGNVYSNDVCQCSGTTPSPDQTWGVTCSGDGIDGVIGNGNASWVAEKIGNSTYRCVDNTLSHSSQLPYGTYNVLFDAASTDWDIVDACGTSRNLTLSAPMVSVSQHFYQCQPAEPWWQSVGGNIHGQDAVKSNVPSGQALIIGSNAIVSYGNTLDLFGGSISSSGWAAQSEYDGPEYTYDWWVRQLKDQDRVTGTAILGPSYNHDGVYTLNGNSLRGSLPTDRKVVILVDHSITINGDIDVPVGSFLMVISNGTITVNDSLGGSAVDPVLEGIFIADKINFGSGSTHLFAAGSFIAWSSAADSITVNRNIGSIQSAITPSVTFISRPDLLLNAPDFVRKVDYNWQQVPG